MKSQFLLCGALLLGTILPASAKVITKTVEYKDGSQPLVGYLAYDDSFKGKRPGVLVAHQWMGLTENEKMRSRMLAQLGYVAFALDIYGKGNNPSGPKAAGALAGKYYANRPLLRERARAALMVLRQQPNVDTNRLACIGYCFGGGTTLELARSGANLKGFVTFHGSLDTPDTSLAKNIKGKILVCHGALDPHVTAKNVDDFRAEMDAAKVDYQLIEYSGAVHAFTQKEAGNDNSKGAAYNEKADKRSWQAMKDFFAEIF